MKIKALFLMMAIGSLAFFLTALPYGCTKSNEKEKSSTQADEVAQEDRKDLAIESDTVATIAEITTEKTESRAIETTKKTETSTIVAPKSAPKPAEEKKTSAQTPKPKPVETPPVVKEVETKTPPAPNAKMEAPKTAEQPKEENPTPDPEAVKAPETPTTKPEKVVEPVAPEPEKPVVPVETKPVASQPVPQVNNWPVPESANKKTNPIQADNASINTGKAIWKKHCASCHGKSGLGDGSKAAQLDTPCGDFTLSAFQRQTDGALFYKTVEGRDDMPSYKKKIPDEEDIWHLVNFMRTLK